MEIKNWRDTSPQIVHDYGIEWVIFVRKNADAVSHSKKWNYEKPISWGAACMENLEFLEYHMLQPGGKLEEHTNDHYEEIYYILKGSGIMLVDKKEYEIKQDDAIYIPKTVIHGIINNTQDFINYLVISAGEKHPDESI